LLNPRKSTRI